MGVKSSRYSFWENIRCRNHNKNNNANTVAAETTHWEFILCQPVSFHFVLQERVSNSQRGPATSLKLRSSQSGKGRVQTQLCLTAEQVKSIILSELNYLTQQIDLLWINKKTNTSVEKYVEDMNREFTKFTQFRGHKQPKQTWWRAGRLAGSPFCKNLPVNFKKYMYRSEGWKKRRW